MNRLTAWTITSTLLLSVFVGYPSTEAAKGKATLSPTEVVRKVQHAYAEVRDYQARFVQTTAHKLYPGKYQRAYGTVMFGYDGKMRWEYTRPHNKLFIYDGNTLWVYEPEVPQVVKGTGDTERLEKALAFLTGKGSILAAYRAKKGKPRKDFPTGHVVYLIPKDTRSPFARVELYVHPETFRVQRSIVVDKEGNRNRMDFYEPKINQQLDARYFAFEPPAGVPVITP